MGTRQEVYDAIVGVINQMKADGQLIDANAVASQLSFISENSGLTFEDVVREVERVAEARGAALLSRSETIKDESSATGEPSRGTEGGDGDEMKPRRRGSC